MEKAESRSGVKRVLIVDDHPLLRDALAQLIEQVDGLKVCGQASNFQEAMDGLEAQRPDIALVDIGLEGISGIELIRELAARSPGTLSIVLSMFDEFSYAPKALEAGAKGYIMKSEPPHVILQGIRSVLEGKVFVSEPVKEWIVSGISSGAKRGRKGLPGEILSRRELQVFSMIGGGMATQTIAEKLGISPKTVQTHREKIKSKLRLKTATDLAHSAYKWLQSLRKPL